MNGKTKWIGLGITFLVIMAGAYAFVIRAGDSAGRAHGRLDKVEPKVEDNITAQVETTTALKMVVKNLERLNAWQLGEIEKRAAESAEIRARLDAVEND